MTKQQMLGLMRLLSGIETFMLCSGQRIPDHLIEELEKHVALLEKEILK